MEQGLLLPLDATCMCDELESGGLSTLPSLKMAAVSYRAMPKTQTSWKPTSMLN